MKKSLSFIAGCMLLATFANAQSNEIDNRDKFQFGIKAGGSYSNVYDAKGEEFDSDAKLGFTGGVFLMIPIGTYIGIQPEGMITQKGFKGSGSLLGSEYSWKRTTTYLEVPLYFALKPSEFITLLAGPQFSYLLKQKDEFNSAFVNTDQEQEFDRDNIRKNILGIALGVDINLSKVVLGGRMAWDIQDNKGDGTSSTPRYKNVCAQVTIGYKIF